VVLAVLNLTPIDAFFVVSLSARLVGEELSGLIYASSLLKNPS
jgi:hypothetical protein